MPNLIATSAHETGRQAGWNAARNAPLFAKVADYVDAAVDDRHPDGGDNADACRRGFLEGWDNHESGLWSDGSPA